MPETKKASFSWAIEMEHPMELQQLSRMSHYGTGIKHGLQIPEWDYQSVGNHTTPSRLFLQKCPRNGYTMELKREMVENDRKLKTAMQKHRITMSKERKSMEQAMRKNTKPYVCHRGNILSRYGETFNNLPSSLGRRRMTSASASVQSDANVPLTVVDAETVVSEHYVVCGRCKKTFKESHNAPDSCNFHLGPIVGVFGGMCQSCGRLDYTKGCVQDYHTRKPKRAEPSNKQEKQKT